MAGCKRYALKGRKGENGREEKREEKRKGKMRKQWESKSFHFFRAHVFSYAQWSFFKYIKKTVSRLSRSYPLLFAIKW